MIPGSEILRIGCGAGFANDRIDAAVALVRRLDGIPLAIGMAAAWLPALGLQALNQRLAERLDWLRNPERDAPPRHDHVHVGGDE